MLIAVLVFGLFALVAIVFVGVWKVGHDQKRAEVGAEAALDALFDGKPDVTFAGNMRSMKYETVIVGAKQRGYTLTSQGGDPKGAFTLIFEKA